MADINAPLSVYGLPSSQSSQSAQPVKNGPTQFSAEDVRARMNAINNYIDTNGPKIYAGLDLAERDRADRVAPFKNFTPDTSYKVPDIQRLVSGDTSVGPMPGLRNSNVSSNQFVTALINKARFEAEDAKDPYIYSRPTSFNATKDGVNYDRYYSHPNFKKLGISIYRDNEATYNANSTWSDDFRRMGSKWFSLFGGGFVGMAKSWTDSSYSDARAAYQMEHDMSIASSTKEGFGAKTTNFAANSAYTFGVLAEMGVENFIAATLGRMTGGQSMRLAAANTMKNLRRYTKVMSSTVEMMKDVDKARKVFNAAKAGEKVINLLPFAETAKFGMDLLKTESAVNRLSNIAKAKRGLGSFYRDMRMINAATSESRLEAGFVENKVAQESLAAFKKKNNRLPTPDEAIVISENAAKAASTAFMANAPLIYYTNKFVLDNMFRGFAPVRRMMSKTALNSPLYKVVTNPNWKKAGTNPYEYVKKGIASNLGRTVFSKSYLKSIPSRLGKAVLPKNIGKTVGTGIRYVQANLMEGLQESYQEAVQAGVSEYYLTQYYADLYSNPMLAGKKSIFDSIAKGVNSQFSGEGAEVFASGFLMGGVMGGFQNRVMEPARRVVGAAGDKIFKTEDYKKFKDSEENRFKEFVNAANDIAMNPEKYINVLDENAKNQSDLQQLLDDYEEVGDRKSAEDTRQDSLFGHISTMRRTGNFDTFIEHLEDYKNLSDEELEEGFKVTPGNDRNTKSYRDRLESAIKKANDINTIFDSLEKIDNPFNPDIFDKEKDAEAYVDELISYNAFEDAKMILAFNQYSFNRAAKRLSGIASKAAGTGPFGNVAATDFYSLYDTNPERLIEFGKTLKLEIEALMMGDAQDKKRGERKLEQLDKFRFLRNRILEFRKGLDLIEKASSGNKEALEKLRQQAVAFARESNIIDDSPNYIVDITTRQAELTFEPVPEGVLLDDTATDVFVEEYLKNMLYDAYYDYVKSVGSVNNIYNTKDSAEDSFGDLFDFIKLDRDVRTFAGHINTLSDPMALYNLSMRGKAARKKILDEYQKYNKEALEKFMSMVTLDQFFQRLADMSVYFDSAQVDEFLENNIMPDAFLNADDGSPITPADPKYDQIIQLIEEYEEETGKKFTNKPVKPKPREEAPTTVSAQDPPEEKEKQTAGAVTPTPPATSVKDPLAGYSPDVQDKLREAYTKSGSKAGIEEWMKESPIAASIITPKKKEKKVSTDTTYISKSNPRSIGETMMKLLYKMLLPIYAPKFSLTPDQTGYVSADKPGVVAKRVSDIKGVKPEDSLLLRRQSGRGTLLDNKLRAFAEPLEEDGLSIKDRLLNAHIRFEKTGNADDLEEVRYVLKNYTGSMITDAAKLDSPITITENFTDNFAKILESLALEFREYTWNTNLPAIVGELLGDTYGGSVDLLLEKKNSDGQSEFIILDFKSSATVRRTKPNIYKNSDQIQQNAYADLFQQKTGFPVKDIRIFNMIIVPEDASNRTLIDIKMDKYKNSEGQTKITYPVKRMSILDAKLAELENIKDKEIADIKSRKLDAATEAETIQEIENQYTKDVEELQGKAATSPQPIVPKSPVETTPIKSEAPSRFAGKVIYTPYGFTSLDIFDEYDIINADDVLKEVGRRMGYGSIANYDKEFSKIIFDLKDDARNQVYNNFKEEIEKLKAAGKTIVTSNWVLRETADIISYPSVSKAVNKEGFLNALEASTALQKMQEASKQKGWELVSGKVEVKTRKTVKELLESEKAVSNGVMGISTADSLKSLSNIIALYFANKDNFRDRFSKKDKQGAETVLTPKEVSDIVLERAEQLAAKMSGGGREYDTFAKKLNKMLNKETNVTKKTASKEQKAEVQQVVDSAKDVSAVSTEVADIVKNAKNSTLSKEDRRNKFKDNLGCK